MEMVLPLLSILFFCIGIIAVLIGAFGLIRLPDVYSRIHAAGIIDTMGAACFLLAMICLAGWSLVTVKLVLIGVFLVFTSPVSGHAITQAAWSQGIKPKVKTKKSEKKT